MYDSDKYNLISSLASPGLRPIGSCVQLGQGESHASICCQVSAERRSIPVRGWDSEIDSRTTLEPERSMTQH
jgi:hypothetical protein